MSITFSDLSNELIVVLFKAQDYMVFFFVFILQHAVELVALISRSKVLQTPLE